MKLLWCWRCRTEVPMLDDEEFQRAMALRGTGTGDVWQRQFGPRTSRIRTSDRVPRDQYQCHLPPCRFFVRTAMLLLRQASQDTTSKGLRCMYAACFVIW